jgi:ParB-like nuclease domain
MQQQRPEPMRGPFPRFGFPNMTPEEGWLGKIMTKLPIRKIKVRNRYRKSLGDIESLAANIKELGLLHPIVVRPDGQLDSWGEEIGCLQTAGLEVHAGDLRQLERGRPWGICRERLPKRLSAF